MMETEYQRGYREGAEAMREKAAKVAATACLVPPDGGSPTREEVIIAARAAEAILSLPLPESPATSADSPARAVDDEREMQEAFERWFLREFNFSVQREENSEEYLFHAAKIAWAAWKEARK